jgi:formylglycine-generating enzyme required for sulfatase activity
VRDDLALVGQGGRPFYIYRYEASRVDATAADEGRLETRACSRQSASGPVRPWSSIRYARAQAACAAAGMRLCRTRRTADCSSSTVSEDEWGAACSAGVTCGAERQPYPYGCSYSAATCNGDDPDRGAAVATGSRAQCLSSADLDPGTAEPDRAFDLSGNLAEWTEDCRTVLGDGTGRRAYTLRGGSFRNPPESLRCDFMSTIVAEDFAFDDTGFRCCSSCAPGLGDCGGTCVDQASDPAHCGRCGNSCATGVCSNGRCQ